MPPKGHSNSAQGSFKPAQGPEGPEGGLKRPEGGVGMARGWHRIYEPEGRRAIILLFNGQVDYIFMNF